MAIQFILGRSGTGKTRHCMQAVADALLDESIAGPLILLVPEQATYQAERSILSDPRIEGYNRLHVVSFDRLQYLLMGRRTARAALSRIGRSMIIQRLLLDARDELKVYASSAGPGLARRLADTISELQQYGHTPDDVEHLLNEIKEKKRPGIVEPKLHDIAILYERYQKFVSDKFIDGDAQLLLACKQAGRSQLLKGAKLWVDGFAGFTGAEMVMLMELLRVATSTQIALCLDPAKIDLHRVTAGDCDPTSRFYPTERTYAELVERIRGFKLQLDEPVILDAPRRFADAPALAHVEAHIFESHKPRRSDGRSIRIAAAPGPRAEARFAAREIAALVREKGLRYRDIAIVASDIDLYEHYIRAYCEDYGVPVFIDKRKRLNRHPVVELICSALQGTMNGYSRTDVFAYLKSDLVPVERVEVDLLENYCLAFGVTTADWTSRNKWTLAADRAEKFAEDHVDSIRRRAIEPLEELERAVMPEGRASEITALEFTKGIFALLDRLQVRNRLSEWIDRAAAEGDYAAAEEHRQLYDRLVDVFDELTEVFAGCKMRCEDYFAIISAAFSEIALAFIPPNLDQVLVGSIERSRHPDLKAVFLIGATQRQFPMPLGAAGVLTDEDRLACEAANFDVGPTSRRELAGRQYLAYIAFTRASGMLYVTRPAVDEKGVAIARSQFVDNLLSLFDDLYEETIAEEQPRAADVYSAAELEDILCTRLGRDARAQQSRDEMSPVGLLDQMRRDGDFAKLAARTDAAIGYSNEAYLDESPAERLFAGRLSVSASKLSCFAACPYKYFARHILALNRREEFVLEPLDAGEFYHRALEGVVKAANARNRDFAEIADADLMKMLDDCIEGIVAEDAFVRSFMGHSPHNKFVIESAIENLRECLIDVAKMIRAGAFRPAFTEVWFGKARGGAESMGDLVLKLPDGRSLSINGRIDRLDTMQADGCKAAIVFDYKKSASQARFNWSKFHHGLDVQLPLYLMAVHHCTSFQKCAGVPVGAFFIPVEVSPKTAAFSKLEGKRDAFLRKANGIFNGDFAQRLDATGGRSSFYNFLVTKDGSPYGNYAKTGILRPDDFEKLMARAEMKVIETGAGIISGRIEVRPYRLSGEIACTQCDYRPVCRFDWQINSYNWMLTLSKTDALEGKRNDDARE